MNAAHNDSLLHALESHSKEEKSCDLQVARQIHEYFPKSSDLTFLLRLTFSERRWDCQSSSLL